VNQQQVSQKQQLSQPHLSKSYLLLEQQHSVVLHSVHTNSTTATDDDRCQALSGDEHRLERPRVVYDAG
jgi:hypothetical protein